MPSKELTDFSDDELYEELRARDGKPESPSPNPELARFSFRDLLRALNIYDQVVYGEDNRVDLYEVHDPEVLHVARGVCAIFLHDTVEKIDDKNFRLKTTRFSEVIMTDCFGNSGKICKNERFNNQPCGAIGTAFLIAPDIVATAGHCVAHKNASRDMLYVKKLRFVFGYQMKNKDTHTSQVARSDLYSGHTLLGRSYDAQDNDVPDWALIRLDRPVTGRTPLEIRTSEIIDDAEIVYVLGYPYGLPLKYSPKAWVRDNDHPIYFTTNTDTFQGNSGSPVFNACTNEVEGILVRGEQDFTFKPSSKCFRVRALDDTSGEGEACTRIVLLHNILTSD
ncbi:MAG: trypsin-like serine peptidase [Candidatus Thorarchaeota archaeon]